MRFAEGRTSLTPPVLPVNVPAVDGRLERNAGVTPAVAWASCPCLVMAKLAMQRGGGGSGTLPQTAGGTPAPPPLINFYAAHPIELTKLTHDGCLKEFADEHYHKPRAEAVRS